MRVFQEAYAAVGLGWVWRVYGTRLDRPLAFRHLKPVPLTPTPSNPTLHVSCNTCQRYNNPLAARVLDWGYRLFARYRTDITRGQSLQTLYEARRAARAAAADCERCAVSASTVESTSS